MLEALQDIGEVVLVFGRDFAKPFPQLSLRGNGCLKVLLGHRWHILLIDLRRHLVGIIKLYDIYHRLTNVIEGFRALHPRRSKRSLKVFESTRIVRTDHPVNGLSRLENRCRWVSSGNGVPQYLGGDGRGAKRYGARDQLTFPNFVPWREGKFCCRWISFNVSVKSETNQHFHLLELWILWIPNLFSCKIVWITMNGHISWAGLCVHARSTRVSKARRGRDHGCMCASIKLNTLHCAILIWRHTLSAINFLYAMENCL